jgi:hypothetical protein
MGLLGLHVCSKMSWTVRGDIERNSAHAASMTFGEFEPVISISKITVLYIVGFIPGLETVFHQLYALRNIPVGYRQIFGGYKLS